MRVIEHTNWFETGLFKEIEARSTPGTTLRAYRHRDELSQTSLANLLDVSRQAVCDMEKDRRPISGKTAKLLAKVFKTQLDLWLE